MSGEIRYYKGKHKVKVVTESQRYRIVEALEEFEDVVNGEIVRVNVGGRRIVPPNLLFKKKRLPPPAKEHVCELKMEKKLKRLVTEKSKKQE